jgi:hypothetical protein
MRPYHLQLLQALKNSDLELSSCADLLGIMEEDGFPEKLAFSDEATFHISGKVNSHNVRIWVTENPHEFLEHKHFPPNSVSSVPFHIERFTGPPSMKPL